MVTAVVTVMVMVMVTAVVAAAVVQAMAVGMEEGAAVVTVVVTAMAAALAAAVVGRVDQVRATVTGTGIARVMTVAAVQGSPVLPNSARMWSDSQRRWINLSPVFLTHRSWSR